jgi:EF-hand domain
VSEVTEKDEFESAWVSDYVPTGTAADAINEIKQYAYKAFDKLDQNGNGFIETEELQAFLKDADTPEREKSFITFLLNNAEAISHSVLEGATAPKHGISRLDLDSYFKLVLAMFSGK